MRQRFQYIPHRQLYTYTNSLTGEQITGEQITGELLKVKDNMQLLLLPFAISPLGSSDQQSITSYGIPPNANYKTLHNIGSSKFPNANANANANASNMARARQAFTKTPSRSSILERADSIWKSKQQNYHYGGSYRSPDPLAPTIHKFSGEPSARQTAWLD